MKVNPVAIQSYQSLTRSDKQAREIPGQDTPAGETRPVPVEPQQSVGSTLAVRGPQGTYADYLSDGEKEALELLFARFHDTGRFGHAASGATESTVGRIIDLKV